MNNSIQEYGCFNYIAGLDVEIIQIKKSGIIDFTDHFTQPDEKLFKFSFQTYKCKIIYNRKTFALLSADDRFLFSGFYL